MENPISAVSLVILLCFAFGCQNKAEKAELQQFKARADIEKQNEALVVNAFDGLNKKNADVYQELYAPEYRWHFPSANQKGLSREEESVFVKLLWAAFPDIHWDIEEMIAHGDRIIVRFVVWGTHTGGEYQGLLPTGNKFEGGGLWMARVKDGKLVEAREEADVLGWMQQLGMELKPKETKK